MKKEMEIRERMIGDLVWYLGQKEKGAVEFTPVVNYLINRIEEFFGEEALEEVRTLYEQKQ